MVFPVPAITRDHPISLRVLCDLCGKSCFPIPAMFGNFGISSIDSPISQISQPLSSLATPSAVRRKVKSKSPDIASFAMSHQGVLLRQRALRVFDFQLPNYQITHLPNLADPISRSSPCLCVSVVGVALSDHQITRSRAITRSLSAFSATSAVKVVF